MVETTIIPNDTNFLLSLPQQFIGKKIKVLMYAVDEIIEPNIVKTTKKAAQFRGMFTEKEGENFHKYLAETRNEWERNI